MPTPVVIKVEDIDEFPNISKFFTKLGYVQPYPHYQTMNLFEIDGMIYHHTQSEELQGMSVEQIRDACNRFLYYRDPNLQVYSYDDFSEAYLIGFEPLSKEEAEEIQKAKAAHVAFEQKMMDALKEKKLEDARKLLQEAGELV